LFFETLYQTKVYSMPQLILQSARTEPFHILCWWVKQCFHYRWNPAKLYENSNL